MKKTFVLSLAAMIYMALTLFEPLSTFAQTTDVGERNKEVIRQYQERINNGDAKGAAEYIADDMKNFGHVSGREGIQRVLDDIFATFPDWRMEILEIVAVGDVVVVRQKISGTHQGTGRLAVNGGLLVGVQPTGKWFEVTHMHWYTLRDGKIVGHYGNRDDLGMMQQLGLVPTSLALIGDSATAAKAPTADEPHKMLARSNGTWVGEATMWVSPDAPPITSTSILTNTMAMGGLYQVSEIKGNTTGPGKPWTGVRITGYDNERKVFTRAMIGEGGAAGGVAMEGAWDEATRSITMPFKKFDSSTGQERSLKEVYKIIDDNTEVLEIYATDPKTKKEFKMLNVKWTRK